MHRMPSYFVLPGDYTAAVRVGALNAVHAHRERDRWNLARANLDGANLARASLDGANLYGARVAVDQAVPDGWERVPASCSCCFILRRKGAAS